MLRTFKNNALFFLLLFSPLSLSGEWKQRIYSALPKIALITAFVNNIAVPLAQNLITKKFFRENADTYADNTATQYVTKILRERNAIGPDETVLARWGSAYCTHCDTVIEVPLNPESAKNMSVNGLPEMSILHEEGHRRNQDSKKRLIVATTFDTVFLALGAFIARKAIFTPSLTVYEGLGRAVCALYIPLNFAIFMSIPLKFSYCRDQERKADTFAIKHAKNPEELEQQSAFFQKHHAEFVEETHNKLPLFVALKQIADLHPTDLERAERFKAAADDLRAKQKNSYHAYQHTSHIKK